MNFKIGDRVAYFLNLGADRAIRNLPASNVVHVPDDISFPAAATLLTKGFTASMLNDHVPNQPDNSLTVLVTGATGGVATLLIRLLKQKNVYVIGTVSQEKKQATALENGADKVILTSKGTSNDELMRLTTQHPIDFVFDGVGKDVTKLIAKILNSNTEIIGYGGTSGMVSAADFQKYSSEKVIHFSYAQVGNYLGKFKQQNLAAKQIFEFIRKGIFDGTNIHIVPFQDIAKIHQLTEDHKLTGEIAFIL